MSEQIIARIADKLDGIFVSDLSTAERNIVDLLREEGYVILQPRFDEEIVELTRKANKCLGKRKAKR